MSDREYPPVPRVAVGAVILHQGKALLIHRKHPPAAGLWAIPGGRVHLGETLVEAVAREVLEETGLQVDVGDIVYTFDNIIRDDTGQVRYHYVIIDFLANPLEPGQPLTPADDVSDAGWFTLEEMKRLPITRTSLELIERVILDNSNSG